MGKAGSRIKGSGVLVNIDEQHHRILVENLAGSVSSVSIGVKDQNPLQTVVLN